VITPRTTRLLRSPDLQALHRHIAEAIALGRRPAAVLVPTAAAGAALRRTLAAIAPASSTAEILTRDELYARLHEHYVRSTPDAAGTLLTAFDREVLLLRACEDAQAAGAPPPFRVRPGLVAEILGFYDELRRRDRTVADFDRLMTDSLQPSIEIDRGAERLYRQTRFLVSAFEAFESLVGASGRLDEHALRARLLETSTPSAFRHVIVTVPDQAADPHGLWTADYDLLARMHGLDAIDVIATENVLAAGFHQRIHDLLPGIDEQRAGTPSAPPVLIAPAFAKAPAGKPAGEAPRNWFVLRDREEELADVARMAAGRPHAGRLAVVYQRPLPYLYLARAVFADAGQPYQVVDALPLAAEPFAAALDLVFSFLAAEANRSSLVHLLRSPHWRFPELDAGTAPAADQVAALDRWLRESKYLGGWERLAALAVRNDADANAGRRRRRAAAEEDYAHAVAAAIAAAAALEPVRNAPAASLQIRALVAFIHARESVPSQTSERHLRTRGAVIDALESLAAACAAHGDAPMPIELLSGAVRRWIDGQTFTPATGSDGVLLLDAPAAAYADVDEVRLVGLVEADWPERARRSIFYPSNLLSQLGWPNEADRLGGARARFHDLLLLPRERVSASTFTLEDDAIVAPSPLLEEIDASGLAVERPEAVSGAGMFAHDRLVAGDEQIPGLSAQAEAWLALRASRSPLEDAAFHGSAGARAPAVYAVSHVERYLECPFKYFAARVLQLDEEREDESGLSPQERGQLLHEVFETFFRQWHADGQRAITTANLPDALGLFASVAETAIARLPEADRALERTYLLGSAAAAGLGERAFNFEIEQECGVLERLLEHPLEGEFEFTAGTATRRIQLRAKADRIDLLEDGTLRVIDYKLSRAPKPSRALQLPVYGLCAEQHLAGTLGRDWKVSRAGYVAFKEKHAFVAVGASTTLERALEEGAGRLVAAVEGIEAGAFPVKPDEPYRCMWCGYAGVCRKDYIGDE
jgi:RecB family exonuclease